MSIYRVYVHGILIQDRHACICMYGIMTVVLNCWQLLPLQIFRRSCWAYPRITCRIGIVDREVLETNRGDSGI